MSDVLPWVLSSDPATTAHAAGALVLRVAVGLLLLYYHGLHKLSDGLAWRRGDLPAWPFVTEIREAGFPAALPNAIIATAIQLLGGIYLVLGLGTRPAALLIAGTLLGAVYTNLVLRKSNQLALVYLAAVLAIALLGPGKWSLDHLILSSISL